MLIIVFPSDDADRMPCLAFPASPTDLYSQEAVRLLALVECRDMCVCVPPPSPLLAASAGSSGPRGGGGTLRRGTRSGCGCGEAQEAGPEHWLTGGRGEGGTGSQSQSARVCVLRERRSMCAYVRVCVCICASAVGESSTALSQHHLSIGPSTHPSTTHVVALGARVFIVRGPQRTLIHLPSMPDKQAKAGRADQKHQRVASL